MPPRDCLSYITESSHINPDCSPYRKLSGRKVLPACLWVLLVSLSMWLPRLFTLLLLLPPPSFADIRTELLASHRRLKTSGSPVLLRVISTWWGLWNIQSRSWTVTGSQGNDSIVGLLRLQHLSNLKNSFKDINSSYEFCASKEPVKDTSYTQLYLVPCTCFWPFHWALYRLLAISLWFISSLFFFISQLKFLGYLWRGRTDLSFNTKSLSLSLCLPHLNRANKNKQKPLCHSGTRMLDSKLMLVISYSPLLRTVLKSEAVQGYHSALCVLLEDCRAGVLLWHTW